MKVLFLLILIVLLLSILAIPLQAGIQAGNDAPGLNDVQTWIAAGRSKSENKAYQLTSINWRVSGVSAGNDYSLSSPQAPADSSAGCCCTFLPFMCK